MFAKNSDNMFIIRCTCEHNMITALRQDDFSTISIIGIISYNTKKYSFISQNASALMD